MLQEEEQMLVNMKKILEIAEAEGYAIPCINTPNEETVRAVIGAAEELLRSSLTMLRYMTL